MDHSVIREYKRNLNPTALATDVYFNLHALPGAKGSVSLARPPSRLTWSSELPKYGCIETLRGYWVTVLTVVSTTRIALEDAEDVLMFLLVVLILSTKLW
jgi:hypothetical protein